MADRLLKDVARDATDEAFRKFPGPMMPPMEERERFVDFVSQFVLAAIVNHQTEGKARIEIGSLVSAKTKRGRVEMTINATSIQLSIDKAKEVSDMLHGAIEAATSDEIIFGLFGEMNMSEAQAGQLVLAMRERRQGSKGVVYPS